MATNLRAHAMLKTPAGRLDSGDAVSVANVEARSAPQGTRQAAREALERLGFRVRRVTPFSITIEGSAERFEAVFGTPSTVPEDLQESIDAIVWPQPTEPYG